MTELKAGVAYFLIRLQPPPAEDPRSVAGMVERMGTGEKRGFQSGEELLHLLTAWWEKPPRSSGGGASEESLKMAQEDT